MSLLYNLSTLFPSLERPHQKRDKKRAENKDGEKPESGPLPNGLHESESLATRRSVHPSHPWIGFLDHDICELDMSTTKWHRKNVEGSLFVVERKVGKGTSNSNSRFQFVVLNRLSDERFVESIAKDAVELSEKYLLYKTDSDEVRNGCGFTTRKNRRIYTRLFRECKRWREVVYTNNEDSVGKSSSSIDDVASLFQSAMGVEMLPLKSKPKKPDGGKKKSGGGGNGEAAITRDAIRKAMLRLATNDAFLDAIAERVGTVSKKMWRKLFAPKREKKERAMKLNAVVLSRL